MYRVRFEVYLNKILVSIRAKKIDRMVVDFTTLKMARKPVKLQKENPAGCAGEGKQNIGNLEKRKVQFKDNR